MRVQMIPNRKYVFNRCQWWSAPAACLATLLALPVHAGVVIPSDPLITAARVAPNILFILDDSGSMQRATMPFETDAEPNGSIEQNSHYQNTLMYNPEVTYLPWMTHTGTRMTGGTSIFAVNTDNDKANVVTINLMNPSDCRSNLRNGSNRNVCGGLNNRTFYILRSGQTPNIGDAARYYRYQIIDVAGSPNFVRSEWGNSGIGPWNSTLGCNGSGSGDGWRNCMVTLPSSRSLSDELKNYATWFSYHRTRMKAAKAGASEAFSSLDSSVRVGFRTIWQKGANHTKPIPVAKGDGRFINDSSASPAITNRSDWYNAMQVVTGGGTTPLLGALYQAGRYFSNEDFDGPYGPAAKADQLSCRQNFSILTTDGYWNTTSYYSSPVGNADGTAGSLITGPGGKTYQYSPKAPYSDTYPNTLADVAMHFWKTDLRTDLVNNVPTSATTDTHPKDGDPAFWQHMVTFGISIGIKGTKPWDSVAIVPVSAVWPDVIKNSGAERIDDLLHAAVNGYGTFLAASNPSDFTMGLKQALAAISKRTSSFSNVATNAASIKTGGKVYNASYVSGGWTGQLGAWLLDTNNDPTSKAWDATIPAFAARTKVFTINGGSGHTFPTSSQISALTRTGGVYDYPVSGANNAAYIKGDASQEERNGGVLRNRDDGVLGDIVNSSPFYVDDTDTLYVGANDGMLHAFDAGTGVEQFAYVPGIISIGDLAQLSRGDYTHKWFVDGPIVVTNRKLTPSKNILIGGLGRGGKGLYALDVTNPAGFGTTDVKWEIGGANPNMGMVTSRPILTRVANGKVAAIVGNGVNSTNERSALFVIDVDTGAIIREFDTGEGSSSAPNAMSAPTGILGKDGKTLAYAYAGDRLGNVWKFDMTAAAPSSWTMTRIFTAKSADGTGAAQPITGGVTVATDPATHKRWIFFGTGSYMTAGEAADKTPSQQGMYGIKETGAFVPYSQLQKRGFSSISATESGFPVRTFDAKSDLPSNKDGWYLDLPGNGERIVQDAMLVSNVLITSSMIPDGDPCEPTGSGYINALDAFTGTSLGKSFFDLNKDGDTSDQKVAGIPVGSVNFGVGMPTQPIILDGRLIVSGTNSATPFAGGVTGKEWSRVSWREIRND